MPARKQKAASKGLTCSTCQRACESLDINKKCVDCQKLAQISTMQPSEEEEHLTLTVDVADDHDPATAPEDSDADAPPSPSQVKASNDAEAIVDMFRGTISDCKEPQSHCYKHDGDCFSKTIVSKDCVPCCYDRDCASPREWCAHKCSCGRRFHRSCHVKMCTSEECEAGGHATLVCRSCQAADVCCIDDCQLGRYPTDKRCTGCEQRFHVECQQAAVPSDRAGDESLCSDCFGLKQAATKKLPGHVLPTPNSERVCCMTHGPQSAVVKCFEGGSISSSCQKVTLEEWRSTLDVCCFPACAHKDDKSIGLRACNSDHCGLQFHHMCQIAWVKAEHNCDVEADDHRCITCYIPSGSGPSSVAGRAGGTPGGDGQVDSEPLSDARRSGRRRRAPNRLEPEGGTAKPDGEKEATTPGEGEKHTTPVEEPGSGAMEASDSEKVHAELMNLKTEWENAQGRNWPPLYEFDRTLKLAKKIGDVGTIQVGDRVTLDTRDRSGASRTIQAIVGACIPGETHGKAVLAVLQFKGRKCRFWNVGDVSSNTCC